MVVELLDERPDSLVNLRDERGFTSLHMAVANQHEQVVDELINRGADVNLPEDDGWTPLMFAAYNGDENIVLKLLGAGANPLATNNNKHTAYEIARAEEKTNIVEFLGQETVTYALGFGFMEDILKHVKLGVDPNTKNAAGWTPLMFASVENDQEAAQELLTLGSDINDSENDGWTPLIFAAHYGHAEMVSFLLTNGADGSALTKEGNTALKEAEIEGKHEAMEALYQWGLHHPQHDKKQPQAESKVQSQPSSSFANAPSLGRSTQQDTGAEKVKDEPEQVELQPKKKGLFGSLFG